MGSMGNKAQGILQNSFETPVRWLVPQRSKEWAIKLASPFFIKDNALQQTEIPFHL